VFFRLLRDSYDGDIVCEPRHATWFDAEVDTFLTHRRVARGAADPQEQAQRVDQDMALAPCNLLACIIYSRMGRAKSPLRAPLAILLLMGRRQRVPLVREDDPEGVARVASITSTAS
jgi:hypothetical protein